MNNDGQAAAQEKKMRMLDVLKRVDSFMSTLTDTDRLLEQIMQESQSATGATASSLALLDEASDAFVFHVVLGDKGAATKQIRIGRTEGIIGEVARTGAPLKINDAYADGRFSSRVDQATGFVTRSILAVPMVRHERLIGVIEVLNKQDGGAFTDEDQGILEMLAHQAAIAIENARLYQDSVAKARLASLGQGIAGAAHCIKNILGVITMGADGVDLGLANGNLQLVRDAWDPLQKGCRRITELVMDMLAYAKERTPERTPVALNELLRDIAAMVSPSCRERGVTLETLLDPRLGTLQLDRSGVHRCVMNLVSNALDALGTKGGTVTITSALDEGSAEAVIAVVDNGPGIPQENLHRIFDVFYSTKGSKGTGLGLALTRKIIEEHGGLITVSSQPGQGATFTIRLPLHAGKE